MRAGNLTDFIYHKWAKPLLFRLDAETAHSLIASGLIHLTTLPGSGYALRALLGVTPRDAAGRARLAQQVCGIRFPNPVGMAAGFDKTGELYPVLANMGFGFVECGTFTAHGQPGNERPRMFRFPEAGALVNRMGFNNPGSEQARETLARQKRTVPRGVNIGKSKITELNEAGQDYLASLERLEQFADYVAVNISSPNTPGLRKLQGKKYLSDLLLSLRERLDALGTGRVTPPTPLFVKIAPDVTLRQLETMLESLLEAQVAGIIISNTTIDKHAVPEAQDVEGGLSGSPVQERSTELIEYCYRAAGEQLAIIGVGGVRDGRGALEKLLAGASLVQVYTGYIYAGPTLPARINLYLDAVLRRAGLNVPDLVGLGRDRLNEFALENML